MEKNNEVKEKQYNRKGIIIFCIILIIITIFMRLYAYNENNFMYKGEYELIYNYEYSRISTLSDIDSYIIVESYSEYSNFVQNKNIPDNYNSNFFENNSLLLLSSTEFVALHSVAEQGNTANIELWSYKSIGTVEMPTLFIIPVSKNITNINISQYHNTMGDMLKTTAIFLDIIAVIIVLIIFIKNSNKEKSSLVLTIVGVIICLMIAFVLGNKVYTVADKPIIYLYPTQEQNVSVNLNKPDKITCSYPKYTNGWNVLAKPNGDLTDLDTGKNLYSLYYESENSIKFKKTNEGFCVKGEDIASFLEDKLAILGLNERESEEFIIYWLPKLEANKYNYIRFATENEINENMPLEISPKPDTKIRVLMTYKGLNRPVKVEEQELVAPERNGFVVVEWGGTEIK